MYGYLSRIVFEARVVTKTLTSVTLVILLMGIVSPLKAEQIEFKSRSDVDQFLSMFSGRVNFAGHGSKGQIAESAIPKLNKELDKVVHEMNLKYGVGKWIAMFGGDSYNVDKPDIAYALKYLKDTHNVELFAAQSDIVKEWGGVDKHIDYVYYAPTGYEPKLDETAKPIIENGVVKQQVIWGGFRNGKGVGPTGFFLSPEKLVTTDFVAVGGGPVTAQEFVFARHLGLPTTYIKTAARFPEVNGLYGSLEDIVNTGASQCHKFYGQK